MLPHNNLLAAIRDFFGYTDDKQLAAEYRQLDQETKDWLRATLTANGYLKSLSAAA